MILKQVWTGFGQMVDRDMSEVNLDDRRKPYTPKALDRDLEPTVKRDRKNINRNMK